MEEKNLVNLTYLTLVEKCQKLNLIYDEQENACKEAQIKKDSVSSDLAQNLWSKCFPGEDNDELQNAVGEGNIWTVNAGKKVIGTLIVRKTSPLTFHVSYVCTDDGFRRQGIAQKLFTSAFDDIEKGVLPPFSYQLEVKKSNPGAKVLYEKLGFTQLKDDSDNGQSLFFIMERKMVK